MRAVLAGRTCRNARLGGLRRTSRDLYRRVAPLQTPAEILADYESASARGLELLAAVAKQDVELPLGDVGTYRRQLSTATLLS